MGCFVASAVDTLWFVDIVEGVDLVRVWMGKKRVAESFPTH